MKKVRGRSNEEKIIDHLDIDELRLDREWAEQPKLYREWSDRAANAKRDLDIAVNHLDEVKVALYLDIASNPEQYDLPKATENAINSAVSIHSKYIKAKQRVVEARHKVALCNSQVAALDHRKKALENMVKLFLADYGATPQAPASSRESLDEMRKRRHYKSRKIEELEEEDGDE